MARSGVVTIRDVARESGYSASTVSIVLNNAPLARYIPSDTKSLIETTASDPLFTLTTNSSARSLLDSHIE